MQPLTSAHLGQIYYIDHLEDSPQAAQLREIGFVSNKEICLIALNADNAIVKVENSRMALSMDFLKTIFIKNQREKEEIVPLSALTVGETGIVRQIEAEGEMKRRLMDMGITRGTSILVYKLAPLGDPVELHLRGYALSLRKVDAATIKVVKENA